MGVGYNEKTASAASTKVSMARQNSVESVNHNSSSEDHEELEDEDEVDDLVSLLKGQTFTHFHVVKKPPSGANLCSIPEDALSPRTFYYEEEPIFHRSPVTLENGYKPVKYVTADESSDLEEEEEKCSLSIWCLMAFVSFVLRCLLILACLASLFIGFVLLTHQHSSGYGIIVL